MPVETESHYGNPMLDYHREVLPKISRTYTMCSSEIALSLQRILSAHEKVKVLINHKRALPKVLTPPKNTLLKVFISVKSTFSKVVIFRKVITPQKGAYFRHCRRRALYDAVHPTPIFVTCVNVAKAQH